MNIVYILLFIVLASTGIGYAYIKSNLNINGTANVTAARWDVHFTNLNVTTGSVTATTAASITDPTTVTFAATLDEPNDFYEFTVDVINQGTMDAMIDSYSISPILTTAQQKYLEYIVTYSDGTPLVNKQELKVGTTETLKVRFYYKENSDKTNYPTEDQSFSISFTVAYTQADGSETEIDHSFNGHSWETIINNVRSGNIDIYNIGDTKEVELGTFGTHTLRIANMSTPAECSISGFSQTACGFVLEFTDLIASHRMNPHNTAITTPGYGNIGGWPASDMRSYVSSDIYNAIPIELKSGIIDTTVVSGHGSRDSNNFTSIDKLYLLSPHEVYEDADGDISSGTESYDSAYSETRQLDYYNDQNIVTGVNYAGTIKSINGKNHLWWFRTAFSGDSNDFFRVSAYGTWDHYYPSDLYGVSPAFRIG